MLTWRDASIQALQGAGQLTAKQIVDRIEELGLRPLTGMTPEASVGAQMYTSIADGDPRIRQVAPGVFEHTGTTEQPRTLSTLGRLEMLNVREVWADEARNFTPWLLDNAGYLSEVLGIEIELEERERAIGSFSLDLFGRDLTNEAPLIVENQLEETDHRHLGQLLTYAAGTDATTVLWVASKFRDEHRQALEYLNNMSGETARFFGIEIQVAVIGDSDPAPIFNVVVQPSDWRAQVAGQRPSSGLTELQIAYRSFWTQYLETIHETHPGATNMKAPQRSNWMNLFFPRSGTVISAGFAAGARLYCDFYIDLRDASRNTAVFEALKARRAEIEAELGTKVEWDEMVNRRACKIRVERDGSVSQPDDWSVYISWLMKWHVEFRRVFGKEVNALDDALWTDPSYSDVRDDDGSLD